MGSKNGTRRRRPTDARDQARFPHRLTYLPAAMMLAEKPVRVCVTVSPMLLAPESGVGS